MIPVLRILHLEDDPKDVDRAQSILKAHGLDCEIVRTETRTDFCDALQKGNIDVILADYSLSSFEGVSALETAKEICPDVPFIFLSGTMDEELAIDSIKNGATDYVLKDRMTRLLPSVHRALREAEERAKRKRAEDALRESEEKFRLLFESVSDVIYSIGPDFRVLGVSPSVEKVLGYKPEELIGRWIQDLGVLAPASLEAGFRDIRRVLAGETVTSGVYEFIAKDGTSKFGEVNGAPLFSRDGQVAGVISVARDITDRLQAEAALRESERRFHQLFDAAPTGIALVSMEGQVLEANLALCRFLGYSPEEMAGMHMRDFTHPEDLDVDVSYHGELVRGERRSYWIDKRYVGKHGEILWGRLSASIIRDANGTPRFMIFACENISERKRAEEALWQSEARYRAVVEQSPDGIFLVDVETRDIEDANTSFRKMLGYSYPEVLDLTIYDFVAADRKDIDARFESILGAEGPALYERQYRRKNGSLMDVWVSAKVISYGEGRVMCAVVRDLTEKKALEAQFLRAQRMECLGLLSGGIAHDLNNILTPILINGELLQGTIGDEASEKMLSSIASAAQRGAGLVNQILAFSRGIEGERLAVSPKYLLREMETFAQETFPRSIRIESEIPKDLWALSGDATQFHQVLLNLCLNAKDAMPDGGKLTLSAKNLSLDGTYARVHPEARMGPHVVLSVVDTGRGIPPEILPKIFDPFFTTKAKGQGTGLGLSTVQGIVKGHGGFVHVFSELEKGTRFDVYLPASPSAVMEKVAEKLPSPALGKGEVVLVVEDEVSIREITQVTLEAYGYQVISAADGAEAVSLYVEHPDKIQVVLTDMGMPILDGAATIDALLRINPKVKIIAFSGLAYDKTIPHAGFPTVKAFLPKPFTAQKLLETLQQVLGEEGNPGAEDEGT